MIYAVDKAFTGEPGLDLNVFHFHAQFLSPLCSAIIRVSVNVDSCTVGQRQILLV